MSAQQTGPRVSQVHSTSHLLKNMVLWKIKTKTTYYCKGCEKACCCIGSCNDWNLHVLLLERNMSHGKAQIIKFQQMFTSLKVHIIQLAQCTNYMHSAI